MTFRNTTPDPPGQFSVFPTIDLAVHDGARNVRAEDGRGRRLQTALQERGGVNVASVQPRPPVRYRDSARFTLSYTLADGASSRRADPPVGGDRADLELRHAGIGHGAAPQRLRGAGRWRLLHAEQDGSAWQLESGAVSDPSRWLARVTATLPSSYVTVERQVPLSQGTVDVQVRAWADDPAGGAARSAC